MASPVARYADHCPPEKIEMIAGFPTPPTPKVRPLHAAISVAKLIANKEDTRQVFEIVHALAGGSGKRMFERMATSPYGRRVVSEPIRLEEIFGDRERLRALPEGSVGRAYLAFMEGENLTPDGIVGAAEEAGIDYRCKTQFEEFRRAMLHMEVSHDLWHVLTGYGRDSLGELGVLSFTHGQTGNTGIRLINFIGGLVAQAEQPRQPILRVLREGRAAGRAAAALITEDIEALLAEPLEAARQRLNIRVNEVYRAVPDSVKQSLLKPRIKRTEAERQSGRESGRMAKAA